MKRHAFTLIELLITISIIALLAAILFPVFAQVREKARQNSCLSNLRQLGTALLLYRHDYDDQFPIAVDTPDHGVFIWNSSNPGVHKALKNAPTLKVVLSSYTTSKELWCCPSDSGGTYIAYRAADDNDIIRPKKEDNYYDALGTSYIYRAEAGFAGLLENVSAVNMSDKELSVSEIVLIADGSAWHSAQQPNAVSRYFSETEYNYGFRNVFFADGHVKSMTGQDFISSWFGGLGSP